jgi:hypothetical protein
MSLTRRNVDVIAWLHLVDLFWFLEPQSGGSRQQHDPFVSRLIVPLVWWRRVPIGDNSFYPEFTSLQKVFELFMPFIEWQVR